MKRYEGKKVVIIGGTSGMGLATAKMLLDGGSRVLLTGRSKEGLESAQNEIDAVVVSSDARSLSDIDALASRITYDNNVVVRLRNMSQALYESRASTGSRTE